jgi:hypothetical protein
MRRVHWIREALTAAEVVFCLVACVGLTGCFRADRTASIERGTAIMGPGLTIPMQFGLTDRDQVIAALGAPAAAYIDGTGKEHLVYAPTYADYDCFAVWPLARSCEVRCIVWICDFVLREGVLCEANATGHRWSTTEMKDPREFKAIVDKYVDTLLAEFKSHVP